jgi:hypothetical protein
MSASDFPLPVYELLEFLDGKPHVCLSDIMEAGLADVLWVALPLGLVEVEKSGADRLQAGVEYACYRKLPDWFNPRLWLSKVGMKRLEFRRLGQKKKKDAPLDQPAEPPAGQPNTLPADPTPTPTPAGQGSTPTQLEPNWGAIVAAVADQNALAIFQVAQDASKTADQKMGDIYTLDNRAVGWTSTRWADILGVTGAAIRQTEWWTTHRKRLAR